MQTNKFKVKLTALVLLVATILTCGFIPTQAASSSELKDKLKELESQKDDISAEIDKLEKQKDSAVEQKEYYDYEISIIEQEIEVYEGIISELDAQINEKTDTIVHVQDEISAYETQIAVKEQEQKELYQLFKKRIRVLYEEDLTSYAGIVFLADSFAELISRIETVNSILQGDRDTMAKLQGMADDIETDKAELAITKEKYESEKASLEAAQAEQESSKKVLDNKRSELVDKQETAVALLKNISKSISTNESKIKSIEAKESQIEDEIAEAARKESEKEKETGSGSGKTYTGELLWPLPGYTRISSYYGYRTHPTTGKKNSLHTGVDIPAPSGTKILCAEAGTVTKQCYNTAYGNMIVVSHGNGLSTMYAHMKSAAKYSVGDKVSRGTVLGYVGTTGWSTGNHLHFSVLVNGSYVNPLNYFD